MFSELKRARAFLCVILCVVMSACATTRFTAPDGGQAVFSQNKCTALSQWVEPMQWRYSESRLGGWREKPARDRMKFLFTDPYFVPVFGTTIDALTNSQVKAIHDSLYATQWAKNPCKNEKFLMSIHAGVWLARVFDPRFPNAIFSKSFVDAHAKVTRADHQLKGKKLDKATIQLVQKRISQAGFNTGSPDGVIGPATTDGVVRYKQSKNMRPASGDLSPALLARLDAYHIPKPKVTKPRPRPKLTTAPTQTNSYELALRRNRLIYEANPESLMQSMNKLHAGTPINLNGPQRPYFAGVAGALLKKCSSIGTYSERSKLTGLITSEVLFNPLMEIFSNDNLGQAMSRGTTSAGLLTTGQVVGNRLGCGRQAETIISTLSESL